MTMSPDIAVPGGVLVLPAAAGLLQDFRRARRELPGTRPVASAAEAAGRHAALLGHARAEAEAARKLPSTLRFTPADADDPADDLDDEPG